MSREVIKNGGEHTIKEHGMKSEDISPEMKEKIRALVRDTQFLFLYGRSKK
jgi:hypothetical protein